MKSFYENVNSYLNIDLDLEEIEILVKKEAGWTNDYYLIKNRSDRKSLDLSIKLDMPELTENWIFPFNESNVLNEYLLINLRLAIQDKHIFESVMFKLLNLYIELNPKIKNIQILTYMQAYHIMMGMTSGFNYDDIHDYIVIGCGYDRSTDYFEIQDYAKYLIGIDHFEYIPSFNTLKMIITKFNI